MRNIYYKAVLVKKYGFIAFVADCVMTVITGGFWIIWIFVREMRKR